MDRYKFRGKRIDNGEWVYGNLIPCDEFSYINANEFYVRKRYDFRNDTHWCEGAFAEVDPKTVGQYTGLKDKDGREIYEGDILSCGNGNVPSQILWVDDYGGWGVKNLVRNEMHPLDKHFKRFIGTVIGNIHDNPELLEVKG